MPSKLSNSAALAALLLAASCVSNPGTTREASAPATTSNAAELADLLSRDLVTAESTSETALRDYRSRIAPLGEGEWMYLHRNRGDKPYRQRVLQFLDTPGGTVRQVAYKLKDQAAFTDAPSRPALLETITSDMLTLDFTKGCEQIWSRSDVPGVQWDGVVDPETCVIFSKRRGKQIRIGAEARVTSNGLQEAERGFTMAGEQLWGTPKGEWALLMGVAE